MHYYYYYYWTIRCLKLNNVGRATEMASELQKSSFNNPKRFSTDTFWKLGLSCNNLRKIGWSNSNQKSFTAQALLVATFFSFTEKGLPFCVSHLTRKTDMF